MKTKPKPGPFCQVTGLGRWPYMGELLREPLIGLTPAHVTQTSERLRATEAGRNAPGSPGTAVQMARPRPLGREGALKAANPEQSPVPKSGGLCHSQCDVDTDCQENGAGTDEGAARGARILRSSLRAKASVPWHPRFTGEERLGTVGPLPQRSSAGERRRQGSDSGLLALTCALPTVLGRLF